MCVSCPIGRREETVAELYDLFTAERGKLADVGLALRQTELHLEPAVCLFLVHQSAFPHLFEGGVGINTLTPQRTIRQGTHGQTGVPVGGHIGIAGGVVGADIVRGSGIDGFLTEENRGRTEVGLSTAVGTLDVDSFQIGYPACF